MADDRSRTTALAPGSGAPICPLTQSRCMSEFCAWHVTYEGGISGCVATHMADAFIEFVYQMTLN